jgi:DNA-binding XRE family transcriptional regulator
LTYNCLTFGRFFDWRAFLKTAKEPENFGSNFILAKANFFLSAYPPQTPTTSPCLLLYYNTMLSNSAIGYKIITNMSQISKRLGDNIKRIHEEKGMSQGDVSRALDMDRGYISRVENGQKNPTISNIKKYPKL